MDKVQHQQCGARPTLCIILGAHFSAASGGAQYQAQVLADELVKSDRFDIHYLARNADPDFEPDGYSIRTIDGFPALRRFGFFVDAWHLYRLLAEVAPTIIYQQGLQAYTGVAARYARRHGARFVFHIASDMDVLPQAEIRKLPIRSVSQVDKAIGEYGLRRADVIVAQSTVQTELLERNYGRQATMIVKNFHPHPGELVPKADPVNVVWVANFKLVKRPEIFVRLARDLSRTCDARFTMIGRPGDDAQYRALHEEMRAIPNLEYLGELPHEQVNEVLGRAHIFVSTSVIEGFPNTFIQAWSRGLPVVSLGVDTDRLLSPGRIGYCVDDYEQLKERVRQLIDDPVQREAMGAEARRYALAEHSISNVDQLLAAISG